MRKILCVFILGILFIPSKMSASDDSTTDPKKDGQTITTPDGRTVFIPPISVPTAG